MKRAAIVLIIFLIAASTAPAQMQRMKNEAELDVGFTTSIFASYVSANVAVVHKPALLGGGAGAKAMLGITQRDFYVAPYGRLELGWLYFGAGPLLLIKQPEDFAQIDGFVSLFTTLGFGIPLDDIANGKLMLDLGVDASLTPSPVIAADSGNAFADILATLIVTALGAVLNTVKLNVAVGYAAGF
jgi:hypothetical protein